MTTTDIIVKHDTQKQVELRDRFLTPKKAMIYTQTNFDNTLPGMVGVTIFIETEYDGKKFSAGKTKPVQYERLAKIRTALDEFGSQFTDNAMKNTTETSFKSMMESMLETILNTENGNEKD